jgi:hypothetical protein
MSQAVSQVGYQPEVSFGSLSVRKISLSTLKHVCAIGGCAAGLACLGDRGRLHDLAQYS